jgi:hypothetical protein
MSFIGPQSATTIAVTAATTSTSLFTGSGGVNARTVYNASSAVCYVTYGTVSSSTLYTLQVPANTYFEFPIPTFGGVVTAVWAAVNGTAYTSQW